MVRLPTPGGDENTWGNVLNEYLSQAHNNDGSLKGATSTSTGGIKLAGDLAGSADSPTVPELANKEDSIATGSAGQYFRGDKTWQTLDKTAVGLPNVDDTSDADKPLSTDQYSGLAQVSRHPALNNLQAKLANVRATPAKNWFPADPANVALARIMFVGDSITEGYGEYDGRLKRWLNILAFKLGGLKGNMWQYIPGSAGFVSSVLAADWPGGESPYTTSGTVTGTGFGLGCHGLRLAPNSFVELNYIGSEVLINYTKTAVSSNTTPTTVTIDGVASGSINAFNATTTSGHAAPIVLGGGVIGDQFGAHTLRITCPTGGGEFQLEGVWVRDGCNTVFGNTVRGAIDLSEAARAGLSTTTYADPGYAWDVSYSGANLVVIMLGANDVASITTAQYRANLVTIMQRLDTKAGNTDAGYLLLLPDTPGVTAAWRTAVKRAALDFDPTGRRAVGVALYDMIHDWEGALSGDQDDLNDGSDTDPTHLNEWGQRVLAETVYSMIDRSPEKVPLTPPRTTFTYLDVPAWRSGWTETLSINGDTSPNNTSVNLMTHRIWLDAGTYQAVVKTYNNSGGGQMSVSINWTSCGTVDTYAASAALTQTTLATSVTIASSMWGYVTIRALGTRNASSSGFSVTFNEVAIRKTA